MREFSPPQLPFQSKTIPCGPQWVFEEKYDGHRAQVVKDDRGIRVYSRGGHDRTALFWSLLPVLESLPARSFVLDGEICAFNTQGRSDFSLLCRRLGAGEIGFVAFDCVELDGEDLAKSDLSHRRQSLEHLLDDASVDVRIAPQVRDGLALLSAIKNRHGEGIVAKRLDAPYRPGQRSPDWLKIKCVRRQEFVVVGWHQDFNSRLQSLALATYNHDGRLEFRGCVGTGFSDPQRNALRDTLLPMRTTSNPFSRRVRVRSDVHWSEPLLVAEVQYGEITHSGAVRHPRFLGLRSDKHASEVRLEL